MTRLRVILVVNSASCLVFGAIFLSFADSVSTFVGSMPPLVVRIAGGLLLVNAVHLIVAAARGPGRLAVCWFSAGDLSWWLASLWLVAFGIWIERPLGGLATVLTAAGVACLGLAQLLHIGHTAAGRTMPDALGSMLRSWMSLRLWVKIWLFVLNAIFLLAIAFEDLARPVLLSYLACGPILFATAVVQGGLTRASGIGHLLPWAPLMVWLTFAPQPWAGTSLQTGYAALLWLAIVFCLSLDAYDLARWIRGDRAVFGAAQP